MLLKTHWLPHGVAAAIINANFEMYDAYLTPHSIDLCLLEKLIAEKCSSPKYNVRKRCAHGDGPIFDKSAPREGECASKYIYVSICV
jgi:hypothetical protein